MAAVMLRRPVFRLFLSVLLMLAPALAWAQGQGAARQSANQVFTVSGVAVDASSDSAANARPVALQEGQRRAFTQLLRRLTLSTDRTRLPQPSEALLNQTIAGFEIDEERTSATRYIGRITVRFRPEAIRQLLQNAKVFYSETPSRPVLLLPVFQGANQTPVLWEPANPWRDAWKRKLDQDRLVTLRIAEAADGGEPPALEKLATDVQPLRDYLRRRQMADALVVSASELGPAEGGGGTRLEIYPFYDGSLAAFADLESFTVAGASLEEAMSNAAEELLARLDTRWKNATRLDFDRPGQISAAARFRDLPEWVALRDRLGDMPMLRRADLLSLSHKDAQVLLDFYGEPEQLAVALAQKGIDLHQRDGFWEMTLKADIAKGR